MALAPIALFAYRRPRHTLALLESLAANPEAARSHLTIFCDGAKAPEEEAAVAGVRRVVCSRAWCGHVEIHEQSANSGLAQSIIGGVSAILERHDRVIVLEDDLVLSPAFLHFMNAALDRYQKEERVMQVSGYMFPLDLGPALNSCILPMISSWGWATWARAWRYFDPEMTGFEALASDRKKRHQFDLGGCYPFFHLLQQQRAGQIDSWGIRWYLSVFQLQGLTLFPTRSYVQNRGWDGSGTHCSANDFYETPLATEPVHHLPTEPKITSSAYKALQAYFRRSNLSVSPSLFRRLLARMKQTFFPGRVNHGA